MRFSKSQWCWCYGRRTRTLRLLRSDFVGKNGMHSAQARDQRAPARMDVRGVSSRAELPPSLVGQAGRPPCPVRLQTLPPSKKRDTNNDEQPAPRPTARAPDHPAQHNPTPLRSARRPSSGSPEVRRPQVTWTATYPNLNTNHNAEHEPPATPSRPQAHPAQCSDTARRRRAAPPPTEQPAPPSRITVRPPHAMRTPRAASPPGPHVPHRLRSCRAAHGRPHEHGHTMPAPMYTTAAASPGVVMTSRPHARYAPPITLHASREVRC